MNIEKWLATHTKTLKGKTVAVTGSTGGLGRELCARLAKLGAELVLVDRNEMRSKAHKEELSSRFGINVVCVPIEMEDVISVRNAAKEIAKAGADILILNAGAYSIPRRKCSTGFDNIFQINFASPYLLTTELLPHLRENGQVIAVGSIAHRYSKADTRDVDFSARKSCALAYGNSKRYLMFALYELFKGESQVTLSVTHPGITLTNITAHYPKIIFALIKQPMKIVFMSPKKACLSILWGIFETCEANEWIGPRVFDIWGIPKKKSLRPLLETESHLICETAKRLSNTD